MRRAYVIASIELRQRMRSVAWIVLMAIVFLMMLVTGVIAWFGFGLISAEARAADPEAGEGGFFYSFVLYEALFLALCVAPAFSGNAINGDRENATLASVQLTAASTSEIIFGKILAAAITGICFIAMMLPILLTVAIATGLNPFVVIISLLLLVIEVVIVSAIGVAISGLIAKSLISVVATYLIVALLCIGSVIFFGLTTLSDRVEVTYKWRDLDLTKVEFNDSGKLTNRDGELLTIDTAEEEAEYCTPWDVSTYENYRTDRSWVFLTMNPFSILADGVPAEFDKFGNPESLFALTASGQRFLQQEPETLSIEDSCRVDDLDSEPSETALETYQKGIPSWWIGLGGQTVFAAGLVWLAYRRTRTPAVKLPPGTRVA